LCAKTPHGTGCICLQIKPPPSLEELTIDAIISNKVLFDTLCRDGRLLAHVNLRTKVLERAAAKKTVTVSEVIELASKKISVDQGPSTPAISDKDKEKVPENEQLGGSISIQKFQRHLAKKAKVAPVTLASSEIQQRQLTGLKKLTGNAALKQLPIQSKPQNRRHVVRNSVLPALYTSWGPPAVIMSDLLGTKEFQPLFEEGVCSSEVGPSHCSASSGDVVDEIQQRLNDGAKVAFYGTGQTNEGWERQRRIVGYEQRSVAAARTSEVRARRKVPTILSNNIALIEHLIDHVHQNYGSGAHLGRGQEKGWKDVNAEVANLYTDNFEIYTWLNNPDNATHSKTIYLQQLCLSEDALAFIDKIIAPYSIEKVKWENVVLQLQENQLVFEMDDLEYLVSQNYFILRGINKIIRRKRERLTTGDLVPIPPCAEDIRSDGKVMIFKEDPTRPLTDEQYLAHLDNPDFIYGGMDVTTQKSVTNGKKRFKIESATHLRVFNPRLQLIGQVKRLYDKGILQPKETHTKLYFYDYGDSSPVLQWSLFALRVGLLCTGPAFTSDRHFSEITEMFPVVLGFSPETADVVSAMRRITAPLYKTLVASPFSYHDHTFEFCFRLEKADNSMLSKVSGNNCAGYHRCSFCTASFKKPNLLFQYTYLRKCANKTLIYSTRLRANRPKEALQKGIKPQHVMMPHYDKQRTPQENVSDAGLSELILALDPLHNIHGFLAKLMTLEAKTTATLAFLSAMYELTSRDAISKLQGKEHRLLMVYYEDVFLPAMPDSPHKAQFAKFCHTWNEIQYILYAPPSAQRVPQFRLHLHVATFLLLRLAHDLWRENCMCLYFHNITAHSGDLYELLDFKNQSCESGEGQFGVEKPHIQAGCQRQEEVLDDLLLRLHFSRIVKAEHSRRQRSVDPVEQKIEERFRQHQWHDLSISVDSQSRALIQDLRQLGYKGDNEGTDWQTNGKTICFRTCAAITSYLAV
jgi:hypothetical protein